MSSKTELRATLRRTRLALPETEVQTRSARIVARVQTLIEESNYRTVHCYEPITALHEVNVGPLFDFLVAQRVAVYTSRRTNGEWRIVNRDGMVSGQVVQFDCIIVPMLGFDPRLHRLGQGGGYYDRFLSDQLQAFKVGVCFELGKVAELPNEPHDIPLDLIVTDAAAYHSQR